MRRRVQPLLVVIGDGMPTEQGKQEIQIYTDGSGLEERYGAAALVKWTDSYKSVKKGLGKEKFSVPS